SRDDKFLPLTRSSIKHKITDAAASRSRCYFASEVSRFVDFGRRRQNCNSRAQLKITRMSGSKPRKRGSTWDEDSLRRAMEAVQNKRKQEAKD
ncbi:hypothetical protein HF086_011188, partial [Spodoptera exigua]